MDFDPLKKHLIIIRICISYAQQTYDFTTSQHTKQDLYTVLQFLQDQLCYKEGEHCKFTSSGKRLVAWWHGSKNIPAYLIVQHVQCLH